MMKSRTLPVVAIGKNDDGLPVYLSVPAEVGKPVPVMANGRRVGEMAPSGAVTWAAPGAAGSFHEFTATEDMLRQVARGRRRLRASIVDGRVAAIVAPKGRR